ncbi:MAG TPA: ABC transporter substrate-binding protein [Fluviicola sp.]|nr:ABC transporter substrate-binding protein [Fluviicola sp.]
MKIVGLLLLCFFLLKCTQPSEKGTQIGGEVEVSYAKHFKIKQHEHYVILSIMQPETGKVEHEYALVKKADKAFVPEDMDQIEVPVKRMAALSTTHIGMLDAIDALDCVKGATDKNFIANKTILKGIAAGKISAFSDETSITPEQLLGNEISLVVYSGFGKGFPNEEKLKQLDVLALADYDWREEHPLGKAEWIKVFGFLTGKEKEAIAYFSTVEKTYNDTKKKLQNVKERPEVLVGSLIGESWFAPAGESYMAQLLRDAGADYLYKDIKGTGSCERTLEQVFKDQQETRLWINAGATSLPDLLRQQQKYGLFTSFKEGKVYCYTHNSNYFWEMGAVNPHWILSDLATICGQQKGSKLHFYKQLKQ